MIDTRVARPCRSVAADLLVSATLVAALAAGPVGAAAPVASNIAGPITRIDLEERTLTISDPEAGAVTLLVDGTTVIVLDGEDDATLDDLFAGDEVESARVRVLSGGRFYLERATVRSRPLQDGDEE